jgi:hypothetical protein
MFDMGNTSKEYAVAGSQSVTSSYVATTKTSPLLLVSDVHDIYRAREKKARRLIQAINLFQKVIE